MSASEIARARAEAERARRRLGETVAQLQQRLRPATIASNAWEGVKDRSSEMAGGAVEKVRERPVAVSAVLAAFTLFLARQPIKSAVSRLFAGHEDEDLVTTRLDTDREDYDLTAPVAARSVTEGASA